MNLSGTVYHPELGETMVYEAFPLSDDPDTQVAQTINRMAQNVREDSQSEPILREAAQIQASGSGDPFSDTFWHVKNRVGFRRDEELGEPARHLLYGTPNDPARVVEVLIRPRNLANMRKPLEDCDGFQSYGPALLKAQGIPCKFVTVAADSRAPGRFSHVYAICEVNGQRVSFDASHGEYPGWECVDHGQIFRSKEWNIEGPNWGELLFMAGLLFVAFKVVGIL